VATYPATAYPPAPAGPPDLLDGVSIKQPLDMSSTVLNNAAERGLGYRDERIGHAASQLLLAGVQVVQAGARYMARGNGVVATGSSVLGKVLPTLSMGAGAYQVYQGWKEIEAKGGNVTDLIHSREARTGMLQTAAGALLFIPGIGTAVGGAGLHLLAAANEMDMFSFLD
jgi:hypothetical protein